MPVLPVVLYMEEDGSVPFLEWLDKQVARRDIRVVKKCLALIDILAEQGTKLPVRYAKLLRDGIWELRTEFRGVNYRILYFFSKNKIIVISHGLWKEDDVPPKEIDLAIKRKSLFEANPERHSYAKEKNN